MSQPFEHSAAWRGKFVLPNLFDALALAQAPGWKPFRQGIEILPLYGDPMDPNRQEPSAALLHYAAGASAPTHEHVGYEHILVLAGSQRDADGTYAQGALVVSEPGTQHCVVSDEGCLVLAVWYRPVRFVSDEESRCDSERSTP